MLAYFFKLFYTESQAVIRVWFVVPMVPSEIRKMVELQINNKGYIH
jgi:hypothetical protein